MSLQMRLFRQKPKSDSPRSSAPTDGLRRAEDLSAKIEPFVYTGSINSSMASSQQGSRNHLNQGANDPRNDAISNPPARRQSLRARSSSEDPWVMINDPSANPESRTSSIASVFPQGAAAPYNPTALPPANAASNGSLPSSPIQQQQQRSSPMANRRPPPTSNSLPQQQSFSSISLNGHTPQPYADPNQRVPLERGYLESQESGREGSIHSQQDKGGWTGTFFGRASGKEKEANAELMRMIGFLTAAAPDDWNLVLEVCERASANEYAAKEASRALRREFKYGEPSAQLSAARLWAIMLQNATDTFILQTASKKFLDSLEEVIISESTSPVVRERLLDVLASAAYVYGKKPGKEGFASLWKKVRPQWKPAEGVPFDPEDLMFDSAFPRRVAPPGQVPYPPQQQHPHGHPHSDRKEDRKKDRDRDRDKYYQQQRQLEIQQQQQQTYRSNPTPTIPSRRERELRIIPPEEDIKKLFEECDIARNNAQILGQALTFTTPSTLGSSSVVQEFHAKCRASQELIVAQIPWATASAERSRNTHKAAKDSGSDSNTGNKLSRKARDNTPSKGRDEASDLTKEERLLASLLNANEELIEVFRIYDELEKMALNEMEEREAAKRSITETKLDRTQIQFISPDGSLTLDPPKPGASSSSRSASPLPVGARSSPGGSVPLSSGSKRDLPLPPQSLSGDHITPPLGTPGNMSPSTHYPQPSSLQAHHPPSTMVQQPPSSQQAHHPHHHHGHHAPSPSLGGHGNLSIPPPPMGPRSAPGNSRSRTPSPDRHVVTNKTGTPPTSIPIPGEYGAPPSHPPPHLNQRSAGMRADSLRRGESPVPSLAPPGLAPAGVNGGTHNIGGVRIDVDAARGYERSEEEVIMTPIKPSAKALGKRRAAAEEPPDEEELERREEAELEEAFLRSTAPPDADQEELKPIIHYVYDAAAERAKELDALEREEEKERLRKEQARSSMQRIPRPGGGSGSAAQPQSAKAANAKT